jgi:hypothetical protein
MGIEGVDDVVNAGRVIAIAIKLGLSFLIVSENGGILIGRDSLRSRGRVSDNQPAHQWPNRRKGGW